MATVVVCFLLSSQGVSIPELIKVPKSSLLPFQNGLPCHVSDENIKASLLMYASYFVLFCKFFYDTYMSKMKNARSTSTLGKMTWKIPSCEFFASLRCVQTSWIWYISSCLMTHERIILPAVPETKIGNGSATRCNGHSNGHANGHAAINGSNGSLRNGRAKKED